MIINLFKLTDQKIFKKLGKSAYIRNGVGFGFISNEFLYDNALLEIGIGQITSSFGDWGMGSTHRTDSPLKISIDKNRVIRKIETVTFHNSESSKKAEKIVNSLVSRLSIGQKFVIKDRFLNHSVDQLFTIIPCKKHIGFNVYEHSHMLEYLLKDKTQYNFRDSATKSLQ